MTITYHAGFDITKLLSDYSFSIVVKRSGQSDVTVDASDLIAASVSNPDASSLMLHNKVIYAAPAINSPGGSFYYPYDDYAQSTFASVLAEAITTRIAAVGWTGTPTMNISFSETGYYTMSISDSAVFEVAWNNLISEVILGYATSLTGAYTYTGTYHPYYYIQATMPQISEVSDSYEPEDMAGIAVSDNGFPQDAIARTSSPKYLDWIQQFETKLMTFKYTANFPVVFNYETMFEYCRTVRPIVMSGSHLIVAGETATAIVFQFRPEGSSFKPKRGHPDFDDYWHIVFKAMWVAFKDES